MKLNYESLKVIFKLSVSGGWGRVPSSKFGKNDSIFFRQNVVHSLFLPFKGFFAAISTLRDRGPFFSRKFQSVQTIKSGSGMVDRSEKTLVGLRKFRFVTNTVCVWACSFIRNEKPIVLFERNCHVTEKSEAIACERSSPLTGWWIQKE
jgi:hypothetical protein